MPVSDRSAGPRAGGAAGLGSPGVPTVPAKRLIRRDLGLTWVLASVLMIAALSAGIVLLRGASIGETVSTSASAALRQAGLTNVTLTTQGRNLQATVPTGTSPGKVRRVLVTVPGVESVVIRTTFASPAEAASCTSLSRRLDKATQSQRISFVGRSTTITAAGRSMVEQAARVIATCPSARITVGGYADRGTPGGAQISLRRSQLIAQLLEGQGVASSRLTVLGYGDQFPISLGAKPVDRQRNERGSIDVREVA